MALWETIMTLILGIESSCDETAASLVRDDRTIIAHALAGQEERHRPYGGVVPEIAARSHVEYATPLVEEVMREAKITADDIDAVAVTAGPGLIGGVMVGLVTGKALAMAWDKPLIAVNHLEGHALSPRLADESVKFPYLLLLVSGGHSQLLRVNGVADYDRLATTIDDAAGEAFDKSAKILGFGFPGGPAIEKAAAQGDASKVDLPRPLLGAKEPHFSFAGLKSAVVRAHESGLYDAHDIAASFQQAVVDCLRDRIEYSLARIEPLDTLVVAGGVASNHAIKSMLLDVTRVYNMRFTAPPPWLCTDNAAMIAWAGIERFKAGYVDPLNFKARPRWPLDPEAQAVRGAGVKA